MITYRKENKKMKFCDLIERLERENNNAEPLKMWLSLMPKYSVSVYDDVYGFVTGLCSVGYIREIDAMCLLQELKVISKNGYHY